MLRAIGIAILVALVGSVVGWIFYWNGHEAPLHLADGHQIVLPMAIHILGALALGAAAVLAGLSIRSLLQALRRAGVPVRPGGAAAEIERPRARERTTGKPGKAGKPTR